MHKNWLAQSALLALLGSVAINAHAESRLDRIKQNGEITLGYRESSIPFSFLDDDQKPIGYSIDICEGIVEALKEQLALPELKTKMVSVTSSTRIPLVANGTVDLACGSATNNEQRQQQVSFSPTIFVTAMRFVSLKKNNINELEDLRGKTVVSTSGTSNLRWLTQVNVEQKLNMRIIPAKDHAAGFLTVESGRAHAFFMDDVLLLGLIAGSRNADQWYLSQKEYSLEPYGIIQPKGDAGFKQAVDGAVAAMMQDGRLEKIYDKWFVQAIPPKNVTLNWPMSDRLKKVFAKPTDSADPAVYQ
ncbi:amino acid ABC transporter substrate-binding protein [Pusillimonas noertemannii]|uniref:amino acid ABC transporter substrate-binding protein n=1 Tax=Pusillimonas noertemannii TaxID=305977 RepID=UPI00031975EB|nr:amino acid ABC transporter substrate-binding protein [Pusillimonas noertemannii]